MFFDINAHIFVQTYTPMYMLFHLFTCIIVAPKTSNAEPGPPGPAPAAEPWCGASQCPATQLAGAPQALARRVLHLVRPKPSALIVLSTIALSPKP